MLHSCYINNWQGQAFNVRRNRNPQKMLCLQIIIPHGFNIYMLKFFACYRMCYYVWCLLFNYEERKPLYHIIPQHETLFLLLKIPTHTASERQMGTSSSIWNLTQWTTQRRRKTFHCYFWLLAEQAWKWTFPYFPWPHSS